MPQLVFPVRLCQRNCHVKFASLTLIALFWRSVVALAVKMIFVSFATHALYESSFASLTYTLPTGPSTWARAVPLIDFSMIMFTRGFGTCVSMPGSTVTFVWNFVITFPVTVLVVISYVAGMLMT